MARRRLSTLEKLKKMLESEGYSSVELYPAQGAWRTNKRLGVACWDGRMCAPSGAVVSVLSFDTMTDLVRYGFEIAAEFNGYGLELYRKGGLSNEAGSMAD